MEARIDKWLWSVRIFKTRTIAADACKKGRIQINGVQCKPSKTVKEGDTVSVRKAPVTYSFKVLQAIENRVGAKLVPEMMENITPKEQYEILEMNRPPAWAAQQKRTAATWRTSCPTLPLNSLTKNLILTSDSIGQPTR